MASDRKGSVRMIRPLGPYAHMTSNTNVFEDQRPSDSLIQQRMHESGKGAPSDAEMDI